MRQVYPIPNGDMNGKKIHTRHGWGQELGWVWESGESHTCLCPVPLSCLELRIWGSEIMFVILLCGTLLCTAQAYHNRVSLSTTTTSICLVRSLLDSISGVLDSTYPLPNFFGPIIVTKVTLSFYSLLYFCNFFIKSI